MKGKARRLLSWVCVLALCMSLLPVTALAANGNGTQENPVTNTENQVTVNKWVSKDEDGSYRLNMEAYASNEVTSTTTTKPLDIVLVLDVSGSMDDGFGESGHVYSPVEGKTTWSYNDISSGEYYIYIEEDKEFYPVVGKADWEWDRGWTASNYRIGYETGSRRDPEFHPLGERNDDPDAVLVKDTTLYTRHYEEAGTKLDSMKTAVNSFINSVAKSAKETQVDHRISVVQFAYGRDAHSNYPTETVANLTSVNTEQGVADLKEAVNGLRANGATRADEGLKEAQTVLNRISADRNSQKVVVLFTDGEPTSGNRFEGGVAATAVNTAKEMKDDNVTIYTVGIFEGADPSDTTQYNANRYMNAVSSNYPSATAQSQWYGEVWPDWDELWFGGRASGNYYLTASNASGLEDVFEGIADTVTDSTLEVYPDAQAVLTDTLSQYFNFPSSFNATEDVTAKYIPVSGKTEDTYTWDDSQATEEDVQVTRDGDTIKITGFDYVDRAVTLENDEYSGGKLVVSFPIELDEAACVADTSIEDGKYPTNNVENGSQAGLAYKATKDDKANTASTLLDESPTVYYDKESYDANGTDVTVQVYVDGIPVMDPYNYVSLFRNSGNTSYTYWKATLDSDSGIITCDFDYYTGEGYDCVDIDVTLTNQAYVLQGIQSFQSYGSSGTSNVTPGTNKWTIDNVTAVGNGNDPDVKIYLRTKYNVEYYVDGTESTTIQDNGVYIENEDVKTTSTDADKPETGENTWMSWKDTDLKTSITVKELPQNTQTEVYSGWWLNDSAMTGEPIVPNTSIAVSNAKPEGTTITFYGQANTPTADYTVKYEFLGENGEIDGSVTINDNDWNEDTSFPEGGDAEVGGTAEVSPSNTVTKTDGDNYVLVSTNHSCTIDVDSSKNVITVTYALDNWKDSEDGDTETGGDEIPDYQQALIKYVSNENGSVAPQLDVITLSQKDDNNKYSGEATASSKATAEKGYAFDYWMKDSSTDWKGWDPDLSDNFTAQGGKTYTYTANFAEDTNKDDIPDKYQAFVNFVSANEEQGTVSGDGTTQVFTLTDDNDNYVESGTITPVNTEITITPANGYAFDIWTEGEGDSAVNPFTARKVNGGDTITFYANFDTDEIGTKDPDKGDGIPDKYEATVTYKVVGGTWSENGTGTVEKVYTLYKKNNEDGKWTQIDPVPTIQENDIPKVNDITATPGYMLPGAWDRNPKEQSVDTNSDNNIYTYTLTQQAPSVKVEKSADKTSVKVGETINYTVTVTNDGNVNLTDVAVKDEMMSSTTTTVTAKDSTGAEVALDGTWNGSTYTIANLPVAVTYTFEYSYTATENDVKSGVSNTVTVDAPDLPEDPDDTVTITVDVLAPAIDIVKTLTAVNGEEVPTNYNAQVGDALTYTITVNNIGNTAFTGITVTDTMWASDKVTTATLGEDQRIDVSEGQYQYTNNLMPETSIKITYIYTVQSSDIGTNEISNTASVSTGTDPDDPKDEDTVTVRMDDYTVTITPANITIYTGGDGYSGVTDGDGNVIPGTETSGLPEPGYFITLPASVRSWLESKDVGSTGQDLSGKLKFTYNVPGSDGEQVTREWILTYVGVHDNDSNVYSMAPTTNTPAVRLAFKDPVTGEAIKSDKILEMSENSVCGTYNMTIDPGELDQSEVKAVLTVDDDSITCQTKVDTGTLTIRSVVNQENNTNSIVTDGNTVDADTITAVADENVTYYVNDSEVKVENENDRVQLLVDGVSNSPDFNKAMGEDAVAKVNAALGELGEGNTLSNAAYDLAYMDLVDTQNGNTVVTMGEDQSLTIYWPVPEDAAEDSAFHVVHYTGMDRENTVDADKLSAQDADVKTGEGIVDKVTIGDGDQEYVKFTTSSFSPFALVYEKAPDPVASLDVTKTLTAVNGKTPGSSVSVGDTLTYTITVTNNGNVDLTNVTVTDTMSNGRTVTWVNLPDGVTNENGTLTITSLAAGTSVELTATYKVLRADASSNLVNTAKVTGTNPGDPGNPVTDEVQTPETPVNPYHPPIRPPVDPDKPELNTEDHYAYIVGYEDGSVQPEGDITRAEVATIFFRLLTDESRNEYWSQTNPYSDVSADDWFNNAVSTLTNAGVLDGYEDGTFKPNGNITRAEFATITARFFEATYDGENLFPDIEGHWAQDYINEAANAGIVNGYEDGTFRPQQYITRAEAVTMVNRTIERHPDADHLLDDMIVWPDNPETAWYYEQIQEATNSHEYTMNTDDEQNPYEIWTNLLPNRDWSELEKEWSDANDGAGSGEVV